ncbi:MAG TPA: tyrosine-type recombinase/integrase [Pseudonocardiaceae bacterium]|nr:tyrosine-type recombinase/integrase [Pseudonocardiaceae bacterium]
MDLPESTSDNGQPPGARRHGRTPVTLPTEYEIIHAGYVEQLAAAPLDDDTRRAYASRVRQFLAWLPGAVIDGDPLADAAARDGAVRDYRAHLQTVLRRKPATINTVLAALADFYTRARLGAPHARRLELPQQAPRALDTKTSTRWLRTVERWLDPRDRVLALLPFYAGLRLGEAVALDVTDVQLSARKGLIIVRSGKGSRYREIPTHPVLRDSLAVWINDERPPWPNAQTNPALLLNRRGGRLSARAADHTLNTIAQEAHIDEFTPHVLRHTFGTRLVREGHDLVVVAELLGHARLDQTRRYSLPTQADRQRAINSLLTDN